MAVGRRARERESARACLCVRVYVHEHTHTHTYTHTHTHTHTHTEGSEATDDEGGRWYSADNETLSLMDVVKAFHADELQAFPMRAGVPTVTCGLN